jgi:hypothetical protein
MRRASKMKQYLRLSAILFGLWCPAAFSADPPTGMLDFDRQVSFTRPMFATVFRAFGDDHTYYVLPNRITVDSLASKVPDLTLLYGSAARNQTGLLSVRGTVDFGGDYQDAVNEIQAGDSQAKFIFTYPAASKFILSTPSAGTGGGTITSWTIGSSGRFEIMASTAELTTRILLIPNSYLFEVFQLMYSPTYRGIIHKEDGSVVIVERTRDVSTVSSGGCALSETTYVNWNTRKLGCDYSFYPSSLVHRVQKQLKLKGFYKKALDGIYGPATGSSIRSFQRSSGQVEDGIISQLLISALGA